MKSDGRTTARSVAPVQVGQPLHHMNQPVARTIGPLLAALLDAQDGAGSFALLRLREELGLSLRDMINPLSWLIDARFVELMRAEDQSLAAVLTEAGRAFARRLKTGPDGEIGPVDDLVRSTFDRTSGSSRRTRASGAHIECKQEALPVLGSQSGRLVARGWWPAS